MSASSAIGEHSGLKYNVDDRWPLCSGDLPSRAVGGPLGVGGLTRDLSSKMSMVVP